MGFYKNLRRVLKCILEVFPLNSTAWLAHHGFNTCCLFTMSYVDAPSLHTHTRQEE